MTSTTYNNLNSVDQTAELWLKIDQLHLNYLKYEDSPHKIDMRKKLEGFIHQYLCMVPQERKFCNPLTSEIIFQSCRWIPNFSGLKAAQAFEAIEKYAANLINQPWRKEFREIRQYGGFYKHQVESILTGAEKLFHLMGYRSTGAESLVMDGPADQDKVTTVARDCVLAYMECQIMVNIVQGVSTHFPCSWEEVLNFRREHVGTPEQAVRSLVYLKNQQQYHSQQQFYTPSPNGYAPQYYNGYTNGSTYNPVGLPIIPPPPPPPLQQKPLYPPPPLMQLPVPSIPPQPQFQPQLQPAQLSSHNSGGSGISSQGNVQIPLTIKHLEEEIKDKEVQQKQQQQPPPPPGGDWDYVYRQLESIGYTKDQGERPNVLGLLSKAGIAPPRCLSQISNDNVKKKESVNDNSCPEDHLSPEEFEEKLRLKDNNEDHAQRKVQQDKSKTKRKTPGVVILNWECHACTFHNPMSAKVCEMCNKSKDPLPSSSEEEVVVIVPARKTTEKSKSPSPSVPGPGGEDEILVQRGVTCAKCTLLNKVSTKICEVCGATLPKQ